MTVHRLVPAALAKDPGSVQLSILENDVLVRTVSVTTPLSSEWSVSDQLGARVSGAKELKIELGAKLSRFSFLGAEMQGQALAMRYTFAPGDKSTATTILTPIDENTFTFHSTDRIVDGEQAPDIAPIKVTRGTARK